MLQLIKKQQTTWELLEERIKNAQKVKEQLEQLKEAAEKQIEENLIRGKSTQQEETLIRQVNDQIADIDRRIAILRNQQAAALPEHLQLQIDQLQAEIDRVCGERDREQKKYEEAKAKFLVIERAWFGKAQEYNEKLRVLNGKISALQSQLESVTFPEEPTPVNEKATADYLQQLREGTANVIVEGINPAFDEAYRTYEKEKEAIRQWAKDALRTSRSTGKYPALPPEAKHYSKERLKEIISTVNGAQRLFGALSLDWSKIKDQEMRQEISG